MNPIKNLAALAMAAGLTAGALALATLPAQAQQRGTGVIEGGGRMAIGGGGMSRGAVAAQRYGAAPGSGMRYGAAGGPSRQIIGTQRYGSGYPAALGGARPLTVSPGAFNTRRSEYVRRYGERSDWNGRRWRGRGWYAPVIGLAAAPLWLGGYGPYYEEPYYDWGGYDYGYEPYPTEGYIPLPVYPAPAPRRMAASIGNHCATPQKTCQLYSPAEIGVGCSCRAPAGAGRYRGEVVP